MLHAAPALGMSDALVILGATGLVIPLFARLGVSPIIGFILTGVAVGPFGLGSQVAALPWLSYVTISEPGAIEPMAEFGIILLLFTIGLELSFGRLWSMRRLVFGVGAAELLGSGAILGLALMALGQPVAGAVGLGLALALSSTALVLPLAGTQSAVGRSAFAMLLFEDLAIVPIIFVLGALAPAGGDPWGGMARTAAAGAVVVAALWIGGRLLLPHIFAQAARTKSPEVFLAASLLVVIVAGLATALAGLSPIVGALLAGMLIAETPYQQEVESMMAPFRGLGLGVFMITVGMSLDLAAIAGGWGQLLLAVGGVVLVKALVTGGLLRWSGARPGTAAEAGVLMASPSETTLIVLAAASGAGLILAPTALFWQTVTAIGLTITPLLAKLGHAAARRIDLAATMAETPDAGGELDGTGRTVIIGFGRVGQLVAGLLESHGQPYLAVEADIDAVAAARAEGAPILFGDVSRAEFTDRLRLGHARALVLTMDQPVLSVRLVKKVRAWAPDLTIVARARDADHAAELYRAGASDAVPETLESTLQLSEAVLVDLGVAMGPVIASIHEARDELRQQIKRAGGLDVAPALKLRGAGVVPERA